MHPFDVTAHRLRFGSVVKRRPGLALVRADNVEKFGLGAAEVTFAALRGECIAFEQDVVAGATVDALDCYGRLVERALKDGPAVASWQLVQQARSPNNTRCWGQRANGG